MTSLTKYSENTTRFLVRTINENDVDLCKSLIEIMGEDVNQMFKKISPLHIASKNGHLEICKLLIDKGSDVNAQDIFNSECPLYIASRNGHLEICRLLLENKALVNLQTKTSGYSPLFIASFHGYTEICRLLLENKADVNQTTFHLEEQPLYAASQRGHFTVCKLLVENGANVIHSRKGPIGTSLQISARNKHFEVYKFLLNQQYRLLWMVLCGNKFDVNSFIYEDFFPKDLVNIILQYTGYLEKPSFGIEKYPFWSLEEEKTILYYYTKKNKIED